MRKNVETRQRATGQDSVVFEVAWELDGAASYRAFLYVDGVMVGQGESLRAVRDEAKKMNDEIYEALDAKATKDTVGLGYGLVDRVPLEWK